ncbi:MAG: PilZ domain-containing protein [Planctomycetes bacterium]|nr:PilZ domain-containing protein [Planctomycetota bacterium]
MAERRHTDDRRVSDRRQSQRSTVDCQIRLLSAATPLRIVQGSLLDASSSGVRLTVSQDITIGEKLLVEARRNSRVLCNVTVQVIWSEPQTNGQFTVGCESLTDLSPRQLSQLKSMATDPSASASA